MTNKAMIQGLRNVADERKNDNVETGETNISLMCNDVANRLSKMDAELAFLKNGLKDEEGDILILYRFIKNYNMSVEKAIDVLKGWVVSGDHDD